MKTLNENLRNANYERKMLIKITNQNYESNLWMKTMNGNYE